jgi:glucose-1-phosphate thymidylyltransferase
MKFNLIIPAAGQATRLRPLSNNQSKAMVRVNGKPCIDFIIEQAEKNGDIAQLIIVDGAFNDIREYVSRRWNKLDVTFVKQPTLKGPHDAILIGAKEIKEYDIPSVVWLGDAIILEEEMPLGTDFLLCKEVTDHHNWCMWDEGNFQYHDKPKVSIPNGVALVGLYSFSNSLEMFAAFTETQDEYDISTALKKYPKKFNKVLTEEWYDIGEISSYYKTCASLLGLKSRAFNKITYDSELSLIHKQPDYHSIDAIETIENERSWYRELDWRQQLFVPRFIDNPNALILSYEPGILLSDLMMYEDLPLSTWEYILDKIFHIMTSYFHQTQTKTTDAIYTFSTNCKSIWIDKSESRLKGVPFNHDVKDQLMKYAAQIHKKCEPVPCMHGDLHLGNILYNVQNDKLSFIDPRGKYGTIEGTLGDNLYDWAKLAHDVVLGYNHIISDIDYPRQCDMNAIFKKLCRKYGVNYDLAVKGGVLLLATCIPLHSDSHMRQKRLMKRVEEYFDDKSSFHSI